MNKLYKLSFAILASSLIFTSCNDDDDTTTEPEVTTNFLSSNVDALGDVDLDGFTIPDDYPQTNAVIDDHPLAPAAYNGQVTRRAQLSELVSYMRDEPITFDLTGALADGNLFVTSEANSSGTNIRTKIDELNFDGDLGVVDQSVAESFDRLADSLKISSENFNVTAANGVAGMITTGNNRRHVSVNGLEYAQILEKGLFGPLFYNQMVDDYTRPVQSGSENPNGNNAGQAGTDYASEGTARQHAWDEAFGYLGADPVTYPNPSNTSDGDGEFIANYTFDFSDETEATYGVNIAQKLKDAFVFGRVVLKAGEGLTVNDESTNEAYYEAARQDVKLYTEAGIAAAAFHYLNLSITDVTDEDKLHHLSEALGFIYSLSFNSEGRILTSQVYDVLEELGWSNSNSSLDGIYEINLWEVTDAELEAAKDLLGQSFPGFASVAF